MIGQGLRRPYGSNRATVGRKSGCTVRVKLLVMGTGDPKPEAWLPSG